MLSFAASYGHYIVAVLAGAVGLFAVVVPTIRERRRRAVYRKRDACALEEWLTRFHPAFIDREECVEIVLRACSEAYGVQPTQMRPSDSLVEHYGVFRTLVLDEALPDIVDSVHCRLRKRCGLSWKPHDDVSTVGSLLHDVIEHANPMK